MDGRKSSRLFSYSWVTLWKLKMQQSKQVHTLLYMDELTYGFWSIRFPYDPVGAEFIL